MDKNTLSEYGWILISLLVMSIILMGVPMLNQITTDGANNYVESFFGNGLNNSTLSTPSLLIINDELTISGSSDAENYEIFVDGASVDTISASHPETVYDLGDVSDGTHTITVVAKAAAKNDSPGASIIYRQA